MPHIELALKESWNFYRKHWVFIVTLLLALLYAKQAAKFLLPMFPLQLTEQSTHEEIKRFFIFFIPFALFRGGLLFMLHLIYTALCQLVMIQMILKYRAGDEIRFMPVLRESIASLRPALKISGLVLLKILIPLLILVPGLILAFMYSFSFHAALIDGYSPESSALERSRKLVTRHWPEVLAFWVVTLGIAFLGYYLLAPLNHAGQNADPETGPSILWGRIIADLTTGAWGQIALVFYYLRLREVPET